MCSVSVTRAMRAALSSFSSDSHLYGAALPVCRWLPRLTLASSSAMMVCRLAVVMFTCWRWSVNILLVTLVSWFLIPSMARLYCQTYGGGTWTAIQKCGNWFCHFSCLPLSTPASSVSSQYPIFSAKIVAWIISFLSGTVFKLLMPFNLLGSRRKLKSQMNFIRVKN